MRAKEIRLIHSKIFANLATPRVTLQRWNIYGIRAHLLNIAEKSALTWKKHTVERVSLSRDNVLNINVPSKVILSLFLYPFFLDKKRSVSCIKLILLKNLPKAL